MTVDRDIARPLLDSDEIERLESIGIDLPMSSFDVDSYHVALLRYAERIMFSPWVNGNKSPGDSFDLDLSDRASTELTRIREEIERIERRKRGTPQQRNDGRSSDYVH